jgi:tRNA-2-methylthio-N6-dimethylallyladenosine synthase
MFKYSERKMTIASRKFTDDVSEENKTSRMVRLVELQRAHSLKRNKQHLGQIFEIMIEGKGKKPNQLLGRTDHNKIVVFPDNGVNEGDLVRVKIEDVSANTLFAKVI